MSYLLDTYVLLWWLTDNPKLSVEARQVIATEPVWVSTAVVWEMVIKKNLGKLKIPDSIDRQLQEEEFMVLDIKVPHVMALTTLANHHADPFDRIQIAQAKVEGLVFVTKDRIIKNYQEIEILPA